MGRRVLIILLDIREFHCFSGVVQGIVYTIYIFLYNVFLYFCMNLYFKMVLSTYTRFCFNIGLRWKEIHYGNFSVKD